MENDEKPKTKFAHLLQVFLHFQCVVKLLLTCLRFKVVRFKQSLLMANNFTFVVFRVCSWLKIL